MECLSVQGRGNIHLHGCFLVKLAAAGDEVVAESRNVALQLITLRRAVCVSPPLYLRHLRRGSSGCGHALIKDVATLHDRLGGKLALRVDDVQRRLRHRCLPDESHGAARQSHPRGDRRRRTKSAMAIRHGRRRGLGPLVWCFSCQRGQSRWGRRRRASLGSDGSGCSGSLQWCSASGRGWLGARCNGLQCLADAGECLLQVLDRLGHGAGGVGQSEVQASF